MVFAILGYGKSPFLLHKSTINTCFLNASRVLGCGPTFREGPYVCLAEGHGSHRGIPNTMDESSSPSVALTNLKNCSTPLLHPVTLW